MQGLGFPNGRNICYMNATLVSLLNIKAVDRLLNNISIHPDTEIVSIYLKLQDVAKGYYCIEPKDCNIAHTSLVDSFQGIMNPSFRDLLQHDATEFLYALFDSIEEDFNKCDVQRNILIMSDAESLLPKLFEGKMESRSCCPNCSSQCQSQEKFHILPLEVNFKVNSVQDAVEQFTAIEHLDTHRCDECNEMGNKRKQMMIIEPPSNSKLFSNAIGGGVNKAERKIEFDTTFHLRYSDGIAEYKLLAFTVHLGLFGSGHYIALIDDNGEWFKKNDTSVSKVSNEDIFKFQPYLLYYSNEAQEKEKKLDNFLLHHHEGLKKGKSECYIPYFVTNLPSDIENSYTSSDTRNDGRLTIKNGRDPC
jgi:ubiquitin C-terminal hydrolase